MLIKYLLNEWIKKKWRNEALVAFPWEVCCQIQSFYQSLLKGNWYRSYISVRKKEGDVTSSKLHGYMLLMKTVKRAGPERLAKEAESTGQGANRGTYLGGLTTDGCRAHWQHGSVLFQSPFLFGCGIQMSSILPDFGFKRSTQLQELHFNRVGISGKTDPTSIKLPKATETRADPFEVKGEAAHQL